MAGYTVANLKEDVDDMAPGFGLAPLPQVAVDGAGDGALTWQDSMARTR